MTTKNKNVTTPAIEDTNLEGTLQGGEVVEPITMEHFFTREGANAGAKMPLYLPDGTISEHFVVVLGTDSDLFRKAEMEAKRAAANIAQIENAETRDSMIAEEQLNLIASLVTGWSFPQECTKKNVLRFLKEAPQIAENINTYAAQRSNFVKKKNNSSLIGSPKNQS